MINFKYTSVGLAAIASGEALVIDKVGFGNSGYTPSVSATSLQSEQLRLTPNSAIVNNTITLINILSGAQEFSIREMGIYLDDDTLLCVWSSPSEIAGEKVADTIFKITIVLQLNGVDASNVTFSINEFAEAELHMHINDGQNAHPWSSITDKPSTFLSSDAFGKNQTLQTFTTERVSGETYTNSTTRTIQVFITIQMSIGTETRDCYFYINNEIVAHFDSDSESTSNNASFMIPPDFTYSFTEGTNILRRVWMEIR